LEAFQAVRQALDEAGIHMDEASLIYDPNNPMELDAAQSVQVMNLIERIEELDDVQNVYTNLDVSDEAIAAMESA
jgi:transcriptional/translational regulatory protein YebC/TACO1